MEQRTFISDCVLEHHQGLIFGIDQGVGIHALSLSLMPSRNRREPVVHLGTTIIFFPRGKRLTPSRPPRSR
jgi:hypothetical protein